MISLWDKVLLYCVQTYSYVTFYAMHHIDASRKQTQNCDMLFAAARADKLATANQKEAPAQWRTEVSQPLKDVMSAMQQMAAVGAQANEQKDSSHSRVVQSMFPDALLACGKSPRCLRSWMLLLTRRAALDC